MQIAEQHQESFMKLLLAISKALPDGDLSANELIAISGSIFDTHVKPLRETIEQQTKDLVRIQNDNEKLRQNLTESVRMTTTMLAEMHSKSHERINALKENVKKIDKTKKDFENFLKP